MKRIFDIVASGIGLILLSPLFIILTIWIKCDSIGPVFYKQVRVGRNNMDFQLFKFRSMRVGSDKKGLITVGGHDPRITRSGYYIRKYKLDEFPQLINVFKGDMSLVGPRPEVRKYVDMYTEEQMHVLDVRPGITDLASIRYRNEHELLERHGSRVQGFLRGQFLADVWLISHLVYLREYRRHYEERQEQRHSGDDHVRRSALRLHGSPEEAENNDDTREAGHHDQHRRSQRYKRQQNDYLQRLGSVNAYQLLYHRRTRVFIDVSRVGVEIISRIVLSLPGRALLSLSRGDRLRRAGISRPLLRKRGKGAQHDSQQHRDQQRHRKLYQKPLILFCKLKLPEHLPSLRSLLVQHVLENDLETLLKGGIPAVFVFFHEFLLGFLQLVDFLHPAVGNSENHAFPAYADKQQHFVRSQIYTLQDLHIFAVAQCHAPV